MTQLPDHYGDVGPGWAALLTALHEEVSAIIPDYSVSQVKEKFGGLRAYLDFPRGEGIQAEQVARERIAYSLEYKYEFLSLRICETCGKPGKNAEGPHRWWKTLCEEHREK
jgi:hypothetical protein